MREQNIEVIRKACVAANPYIQSTAHESTGNNLRCKNCGEPDNYNNRNTCKSGDTRPIRLADVLLVIEGRFSDAEIITKDPYYETFGDIIAHWNLCKDTLTDQSDECLTFLANLLK